MSNEDVKRPQEGEPEQRRLQIRDTGTGTHYANFFTITGSQDAILLSFGNQFGNPDVVQIENKVVLSPPNAKRMAISLGHVIRRYEEQHGEINVSVPSQQAGANRPEAGQ